MKIRFISDGPALLVQGRERTLVVADLHVGIEAELAAHGWHVPSRTSERFSRLMSCIESAAPDRLVLLGDVKHAIPSTTWQEFHELPAILDTIRKSLPLFVLPGNHDIGLSRFLQPGELLPKNGSVLDGVGYLHGHTIPSLKLKGRLIIIGHHHPLVSLHDEVGCALRAPAYILAELDPNVFRDQEKGGVPGSGRKKKSPKTTRVLFMPAFNECAGFDVLRIARHPFSPISRAIHADRAEVLLTDGTRIGTVASLEESFVPA